MFYLVRFLPEDFAHIFTEYGNCFTFNHGENIKTKKKVSVSGRGLNLLFNVNQVTNSQSIQKARHTEQTSVYGAGNPKCNQNMQFSGDVELPCFHSCDFRK